MLSALAHELWQDTVELDTSFVKREAVRFLFTCHTFAPPADRDAAVDLLFDQSAGGPLLDRYREIALARLGAPTDIRVATESTLTEPDLRENEIVETRRAGAPKPKTVDVEPEPRPFIFLKSPKATKVFEGTLSRTGERWSRFATIRNGITITLIDTDVIPLTADLSIHIGRRQITRSDIRIGSRIEFTDDRNSDYRIVISEIDNNTKTIKLDVFEMGK
jgi:hypothetical protein